MYIKESSALDFIEILIQVIYQRYLAESKCLTIISERQINFATPSCFSYLNPENANDFEDLILDLSDKGCSDYIIDVLDPRYFIKVLGNVTKSGNIRRSNRKIVFITNKEYVKTIISMKEISFINNLLIIVPSESDCDGFDLITHKFVGTPSDEPIILDHWDACTETFLHDVNLFPDTIQNLQGKIVKVSGFTYEPYVILDIDKQIEPKERDGIEIRIIEEFCQISNCTIELVGDNGEEWGEIFQNGTGVGVLGNVFEDRSDIAISDIRFWNYLRITYKKDIFRFRSWHHANDQTEILRFCDSLTCGRPFLRLIILNNFVYGVNFKIAALYSWYDEFLVLDFTTPFLRTGITCLAPAPRVLVSWEMPVLPFSWTMWLTIFMAYLFASFVLYIGQEFVSDKVFLRTFGLMISQAQPEPDNGKYRRITGWLIIAGLIIDNAYSSGLAATFTVPKYEKPIDTIQDIIEHQLPWAATHDAWIFSIKLSQDPNINALVELFETHKAETLKKKSFERNLVFSIEKLPAGNFAIGDYITKEAVLDLEIMLEDFYYEQCVIMLRKSSPYTEEISNLIGRLHETGLLLAWETQIALKYLDFKVQLEVRLSRSKKTADIVPLSLHHLVGVFVIYFLGVGLALILFITEYIHKQRRNNLS